MGFPGNPGLTVGTPDPETAGFEANLLGGQYGKPATAMTPHSSSLGLAL